MKQIDTDVVNRSVLKGRRLGRELRKLLWRECAYSCGSCTARSRNGRRKLHHGVAARHIDGDDDVIVAGRHIAAKDFTAQFLCQTLGGLSTFGSIFRSLSALIGPIQEANERRHDDPPTVCEIRERTKVRRVRTGSSR
jgi:hypothetical protein